MHAFGGGPSGPPNLSTKKLILSRHCLAFRRRLWNSDPTHYDSTRMPEIASRAWPAWESRRIVFGYSGGMGYKDAVIDRTEAQWEIVEDIDIL